MIFWIADRSVSRVRWIYIFTCNIWLCTRTEKRRKIKREPYVLEREYIAKNLMFASNRELAKEGKIASKKKKVFST